MTDISSRPALGIASGDHTAYRAALAALQSGRSPAEAALPENLREHRRLIHASDRAAQVAHEEDLCWEGGTPPSLSRLEELMASGQLSQEDAQALFPLYPGQKVL